MVKDMEHYGFVKIDGGEWTQEIKWDVLTGHQDREFGYTDDITEAGHTILYDGEVVDIPAGLNHDQFVQFMGHLAYRNVQWEENPPIATDRRKRRAAKKNKGE